MAKLDDFLSKKKETAPILDLSKATANSKEEFRKLLERVPDFKIKPEKIAAESIKIKEKKFKFKSGKRDLKKIKEPFAFLDPLPREMKNLKISELAAVPIDWKMLTTQRPKTKLEESIVSRIIELKKFENKTRALEKREFSQNPQIRKIKNKTGVVEMRPVSCVNCGEDFCDGNYCSKLTYDSCARNPDYAKVPDKVNSPKLPKKISTKTKRKIKKRVRPRNKTNERKTKRKSKSPKRRVNKK